MHLCLDEIEDEVAEQISESIDTVLEFINGIDED